MPEKGNGEKFHLSRRVRFRRVEDEGVLVHLESGRVLVVNEVGLYIVESLGRRAMTMEELADAVAAVFEVEASQALLDIAKFLDQLRGEQAIDMVSDLGGR